MENQDWASGPPGRRPLGLQAARPLGRRRPRAMGLFLAKPHREGERLEKSIAYIIYNQTSIPQSWNIFQYCNQGKGKVCNQACKARVYPSFSSMKQLGFVT